MRRIRSSKQIIRYCALALDYSMMYSFKCVFLNVHYLFNRSYYTRRKFRPIYAKVMNSYVNTHRKSSAFQRQSGANSLSLVTGLLPFTSEMALFEFPFNELLVWMKKIRNIFLFYIHIYMTVGHRIRSSPDTGSLYAVRAVFCDVRSTYQLNFL